MIEIGLAGWGDHEALYRDGVKAKDKLRAYAKHFPAVEVDSSFYAVPSPETFARWTEETPETFGFVVKAYQGMTGHLRGKPYYADDDEMYAAFRASLEPAIATGKLRAALFQYPPWFECTRDNVRLLREARRRMEGIPCALEFRHRSWFAPDMRDKTLAFMRSEGWAHSVCDEPQAGEGSVPTVPEATDDELTIVRMHGRNVAGWNAGGAPNWREVRYLYRYSDAELTEWADNLKRLQTLSRRIVVVFNNNSGGDAAGNAKSLMAMLGMPVPAWPERREEPEQLNLFGD